MINFLKLLSDGGTVLLKTTRPGAFWLKEIRMHITVMRVAYTGGGVREMVPGDVVTGAISGATATVGEVVTSGGTWAGGNDAGDLELFKVNGTFVAEDLDTGGQANNCTIAAAPVLTHSVVASTAGSLTTKIVDGVNPEFNVIGLNTTDVAAVADKITQFDPNIIISSGQQIQIDYANPDDRLVAIEIITEDLLPNG